MRPIFIFFAIAGHAFLWIGLMNRLHAVGIRRWIIKTISFGLFLCSVLIPIGIAWLCGIGPEHFATLPWRFVGAETLVLVITAYFVLCWAVAAVTLLRLVWLRAVPRPPEIVRFHGRRRAQIDPASAAATARECAHHWLTRLPLNEILRLEVTEWMLDVPRLPPALDGLSIVHLSDLHFTGRVGKAYFREVVRVSNELQPDLVCITGDIADRTACLDWIPDTLGRLTARHGAYFILGNHDLRIDTGRLRHALEQSGLVDLGGRWLSVEIAGMPVMLAGNEWPWFGGWGRHSCLPPDRQECLSHHAPYPNADALRIVLAHSPDRLHWARTHDVDLLLAGHTHGGQICIPPLGAILSPTTRGVRYISGVFYHPPTILHVTRGVSGDIPVRWNCPPELALLHLRARNGPSNPADHLSGSGR